ncbi:ninjurin-1-like [Haliotis asinina]|uniref:ninjurin-1-like n=1 Tax=Haliotis asinina TaxID=109174 RepID=UPI00353181CE
MAPSQEEFEMTKDSVELDETGTSPRKPDRDDTPFAILEADVTETDKPETDEPDGNLVAKPGQMNEFGVRRTTVQNMLDLALVAANISQLRIILTVNPSYLDFYYLMLSCVCLSLGCQVLFAIIVLALKIREDLINSVSRDQEGQQESKRLTRDRVTDILNYCSMALVLLVLLLNMVISAFVNVRKNSPSNKIVQEFTTGGLF